MKAIINFVQHYSTYVNIPITVHTFSIWNSVTVAEVMQIGQQVHKCMQTLPQTGREQVFSCCLFAAE